MRFLYRLTASDLDDGDLDNHDTRRGLIEHGARVVEQEHYQDDMGGAQAESFGLNNTNNNRLIVEPSGLGIKNGERG